MSQGLLLSGRAWFLLAVSWAVWGWEGLWEWPDHLFWLFLQPSLFSFLRWFWVCFILKLSRFSTVPSPTHDFSSSDQTVLWCPQSSLTTRIWATHAFGLFAPMLWPQLCEVGLILLLGTVYRLFTKLFSSEIPRAVPNSSHSVFRTLHGKFQVFPTSFQDCRRISRSYWPLSWLYTSVLVRWDLHYVVVKF